MDAAVVEPNDKLMVLTQKGITIRMEVETIRAAGRSTQGVKLINLDDGDTVCTIERLVDTEEVEQEVNADCGDRQRPAKRYREYRSPNGNGSNGKSGNGRK